MIIDNDKKKEIRNIIKKNHILFIADTLGKDSLTEEDINFMKDMGINVDDYVGDDYVDDAYNVGLTRSGIKAGEQPNVPLDEFRQQPKPYVSEEAKYAVDYVKSQVATAINKQIAKIQDDVEGGIRNGNLQFANFLMDEGSGSIIARGIEENRTRQQIQTDLQDNFGEYNRDWRRIVVTELNNARSYGAIESYRKLNQNKKPDEIMLYKIIVEDSALCFEEKEEIRCRIGESIFLKKAGELKVGDKLVSSRDIDAKQGSIDRISIVEAVNHKLAECIEVELDNGKKFTATSDHPILIRHKNGRFKGGYFYLFWELGDVPSEADIVDIDQLSSIERRKVSHHIAAHNISTKNGCVDFWDFTIKFRNQIVEAYRCGQRLEKIASRYGDIHHKYIYSLLSLSGIKIRLGVKNNYFNRKYIDNMEAETILFFTGNREQILSDYLGGMGLLEVSSKYNVGFRKMRRFLSEWGVYNQHKNKKNGGIACWEKKSPDAKMDLRLRMKEMVLNFGGFVSKPQKKLNEVLSDKYEVEMGANIEDKIIVDFLLKQESVVVEYDGSGHYLQAKLGNSTIGEVKRKDYARDLICKRNGYKVLRINSTKDHVPKLSECITWIELLVSSDKTFHLVNYG